MAKGFVEGLAGGRGSFDELIVVVIFVVIAGDFLNFAGGGALWGIEKGYHDGNNDSNHNGNNDADDDAATVRMRLFVEAFRPAETGRFSDGLTAIRLGVFRCVFVFIRTHESIIP